MMFIDYFQMQSSIVRMAKELFHLSFARNDNFLVHWAFGLSDVLWIIGQN